MKKIFLLLSLVFIVSACSLNNDDGTNFHYELLPVQEVEMPSEFVIGQTYQIKVWYYRPSACHSFSGFYYEKNLNERIVAVQNIVQESNNCEVYTDDLESATLEFYVTSNGSYIFKFWQGVDDNGEDVFYEVEVPVVE